MFSRDMISVSSLCEAEIKFCSADDRVTGWAKKDFFPHDSDDNQSTALSSITDHCGLDWVD